jgi:hypothetical protein
LWPQTLLGQVQSLLFWSYCGLAGYGILSAQTSLLIRGGGAIISARFCSEDRALDFVSTEKLSFLIFTQRKPIYKYLVPEIIRRVQERCDRKGPILSILIWLLCPKDKDTS